ncbi:hypothetical protein CIHG_02649 [Coccidioides immitis H538.4]|uniref:Uncharacterized protein n=3 Tax=Coccidioides immitis TaxID=5501 RepID=A0A0J8R625_COCIT|nr:hypothetical protein CIRG_02975 [Coccidioides immitis RMSCC 2394]KMU80271.1 hypothetical protein CISG_08377 [Coccidioides immitis RMSCC 3703]KMU84865.1 hypothetical protein CIHG_02649 [Coccidioides immitis H538.4]
MGECARDVESSTRCGRLQLRRRQRAKVDRSHSVQLFAFQAAATPV